MPSKPCAVPGCRAIVAVGTARCKRHQVDDEAQTKARKPSGGWYGQAGSRHDRGYGSAWDQLRLLALERDKRLCVQCLLGGRPVPAHSVDHILPKSKGGTDDLDNLQSLCRSCHAAKTAREGAAAQAALRLEAEPSIGPDGRLIIPQQWGYSIPRGVRPSAIPVTIVCGPPASGKTTWVRDRARPGDKVIDLDEIKLRVGGTRYDQRKAIFRKAMAYWDLMIRSLADDVAGRAWLVVTAPSKAERAMWLEALGPKAELKVLDVTAAICIDRIRFDPARAETSKALIDLVRRWER
ncbi:HNH endonuclease [Paracoccus sp. (in: a-proteobacteria)]|uniref:HNH endonuclease n=1 Tax=Paracoccus sp. TaxID=267 RepID=UPI00289EB75C|nr:HNH endonuclease [Paracoccus sp. (in: a-proteobacteria)]